MVTLSGMTYTVTVFQESERNAEKILHGTLLLESAIFHVIKLKQQENIQTLGMQSLADRVSALETEQHKLAETLVLQFAKMNRTKN